MTDSSRRGFIKAATGIAAVATPLAMGAGTASAAESGAAASGHGGRWPKKKKAHWPNGKRPDKPLFSPVTTFGDLVFVSGIGAHFAGDITAHTDHVLNEIETNLVAVGSSMAQVLKVNVYLNDLADYDAMNAVYLGRFGPYPGVRTTIAAAAGIPGDSLVEIDCIACR